MQELWPLIWLQWRETSPEHDTDEPAPDWEQYLLLEQAKRLLTYIMRVDGKLRGYILVIPMPCLHRKTILKVIVDTYFIEKKYRNYPHAKALFCGMEKDLSNIGVSRIMGHVNEYFAKDNPAIDRLFTRLGYNLQGRVYEKVLKHG